jgi:hypothetical protein
MVVIYSCCITRSTEQSHGFFVVVLARSLPRVPPRSIPSITELLRWSLPSEMTIDMCKCGTTLRTRVAGIAKKNLAMRAGVEKDCAFFWNK